MRKLLLFIPLLAAFAACTEKEPLPVDPIDPIIPTAVTISVDDVTSFTFTCTFSPTDSCESYHILAAEAGYLESVMPFFGLATPNDAIIAWGVSCIGDTSYTWRNMIPNQDYVVYVVAHCPSGDILLTDTLKTTSLGGPGSSVITLSVSNIGSNEVTTSAMPNDQTALFYDQIFTREYVELVGFDSIISFLQSNCQAQYTDDIWTWLSLDPNTDYLFCAIGQNANGQWGDLATLAFSTTE